MIVLNSVIFQFTKIALFVIKKYNLHLKASCAMAIISAKTPMAVPLAPAPVQKMESGER